MIKSIKYKCCNIDLKEVGFEHLASKFFLVNLSFSFNRFVSSTELELITFSDNLTQKSKSHPIGSSMHFQQCFNYSKYGEKVASLFIVCYYPTAKWPENTAKFSMKQGYKNRVQSQIDFLHTITELGS